MSHLHPGSEQSLPLGDRAPVDGLSLCLQTALGLALAGKRVDPRLVAPMPKPRRLCLELRRAAEDVVLFPGEQVLVTLSR